MEERAGRGHRRGVAKGRVGGIDRRGKGQGGGKRMRAKDK